jgi:hypothetical protein
MAFDQEICDFDKKGTKAVHFTLLSPKYEFMYLSFLVATEAELGRDFPRSTQHPVRDVSITYAQI